MLGAMEQNSSRVILAEVSVGLRHLLLFSLYFSSSFSPSVSTYWSVCLAYFCHLSSSHTISAFLLLHHWLYPSLTFSPSLALFDRMPLYWHEGQVCGMQQTYKKEAERCEEREKKRPYCPYVYGASNSSSLMSECLSWWESALSPYVFQTK